MHFTALYCTILHHTAPYCTILHHTALLLHHTALYCTLLHHTALYCTSLHHTALYCTIPLVTALLVFVSASTLAMYGGTTDVKDSPAASLYALFYSHLLFLLHFTALYCSILCEEVQYGAVWCSLVQ